MFKLFLNVVIVAFNVLEVPYVNYIKRIYDDDDDDIVM